MGGLEFWCYLRGDVLPEASHSRLSLGWSTLPDRSKSVQGKGRGQRIRRCERRLHRSPSPQVHRLLGSRLF